MYILIFETLHDFASTAIFYNNVLLNSISCLKPISQAENIIVIIEAILLRNKLSYEDIDCFVTLSGPGSFIRTRVALSVAFGIEFSLNKTVLGVNLFDLYNFLFHEKCNENPDVIVLYAYQDNFYVRKYDGKSEAEDCFLKELDLENIIGKNAKIACDTKAFSRLISYNQSMFNENKLFDIQRDIENFSVVCGLFVIHLIKNNKIDLNDLPKLEPFYLINPIFVKKNKLPN